MGVRRPVWQAGGKGGGYQGREGHPAGWLTRAVGLFQRQAFGAGRLVGAAGLDSHTVGTRAVEAPVEAMGVVQGL